MKWDKYYIPTLSAKSKHFCLCLVSSIPERYVSFFPFTTAAVNNIKSTDIFFYSDETQHSDVCSSTDLTFQKVCISPSLYFRGERSSICGHKIDLLLVNKNLGSTTRLIPFNHEQVGKAIKPEINSKLLPTPAENYIEMNQSKKRWCSSWTSEKINAWKYRLVVFLLWITDRLTGRF